MAVITQMNESPEEKQAQEPELVPVVSVEALEAMERAQISELVATAKNWPRKIDKAIEKAIRRATASIEIAEGCHYAIPRDDKWITGPSIKLAKIMAQCWGNCRHATMIVGADGDFIKVRATFYDCEENHLAAEEVARRIVDKRNRRFSLDMIQTTGAAAGSIALRKAILDVIPEEFVEKVGLAAKKVAHGDERPIGERRQKMIDRFAKKGVSREELLRFLEKDSVELITKEDIEKCLGVFTSLDEGLIKKEDVFTKVVEPSVPKPDPKQPDAAEENPFNLENEVEAAKTELAETQKRIKKASVKGN